MNAFHMTNLLNKPLPPQTLSYTTLKPKLKLELVRLNSDSQFGSTWKGTPEYPAGVLRGTPDLQNFKLLYLPYS